MDKVVYGRPEFTPDVIVTDAHVAALLPTEWSEIPQVVLPPGEEGKCLDTAARVWTRWAELGLTRKSLVLNVGGGIVTDLGGFCASTFKRGVRFANMPTTLLAMVDASVGGKTGINFAGVKNLVGTFAHPEATYIDPQWLRTLPHAELLSGYGEVVKTMALESESALNEALQGIPEDPAALAPMIRRCVDYKLRIVTEDPHEAGLRKVLNLGHTVGHAIESLEAERGRALPHGVCVLHGLLVASVLSRLKLGVRSEMPYRLATFIKENGVPLPHLKCADYPSLHEKMRNDKKNEACGEVLFTLLRAPGEPQINCPVEPQIVEEALDICRDMLGI